MNKHTILVVEDEALIAATLVRTLFSLGYDVPEPVATGEDAIRAVKARQPDLVLMDIQLIGEMNGIEAAEKIRAIADIPVVYLTAYTDDLRLKQAKLTDPYGYLVKPAHSRELHATIEMALYKHALDKKLKESEERLRLTLDAINDGIWDWDIPTDTAFFSPRWYTMLGYAPDEMFGSYATWRALIHPDDIGAAEQTIQDKLLKGDGGFQFEFRMRTKDGDWKWILARGRVVERDADCKPVRMLGTHTDITDNKRMVEALQKSEEKYRLIAENTADTIWIFAMDLHLTYMSPSVKKMRGFTVEEAMGQTLDQMMTPESVSMVIKRFEEEMALEALGTADPDRTVFFETDEYCKDGSIIRVENSTRLLREADGRPFAILGISRDITERKRAEEALQESARYTRNLIEVSLDPLVTISPEGKITDVNAATERVTGYPSDYLIGTDFSNYFTDPVNAKKGYMMVFDLGVVRDYLLEIRHRDGRTTPVMYNASVYRDKSGNVLGVFAAARDITERKMAEEALHQANKKLTLLSSITRHDITNQLSVLMGYLTILKKKQTDPTVNDYFVKVSTAAQRISSMIKFTKEYENIGVNAPVWQDARTLVDTAAKEAPLGQVVVKNDLPAGAGVFADPLIIKVFYNLMDNAIRYGGKITTIRFSVEQRDGDHVVVCEDDGEGVPVGEKDKIFERGFGKNTGLGLALSREILSITGITIRENGETGKGARFEMTVPKGAWSSTGKGG